MAASPEALACGERHPGIQQGTPAWIALIRSSDLARSIAAALPTFHHDCRNAIAAATLRFNR
jgi:hypothetical protein